MFGFLGRLFTGIGKLVARAFQSSVGRGLTDAVMDAALAYVRAAAGRFTDNAERREWAVDMLARKLHIPESLARVAIELAVQAWKAERQPA